jgi:hypothetical protein
MTTIFKRKQILRHIVAIDQHGTELKQFFNTPLPSPTTQTCMPRPGILEGWNGVFQFLFSHILLEMDILFDNILGSCLNFLALLCPTSKWNTKTKRVFPFIAICLFFKFYYSFFHPLHIFVQDLPRHWWLEVLKFLPDWGSQYRGTRKILYKRVSTRCFNS